MNRRTLLIAAILLLATAAIFSPAFQAQLVHWDDDINITANPNIQKLDASSLSWMFTDVSYTPRYRPLNWLAWGILFHFFGANPAPYHVLTLLLHAFNTVLLFLLLQRLLAGKHANADQPQVAICAGIAALFWAVHPLRVEAVGWVNCQIYTQSLFFLLLSTLCYLRATHSTTPMRNWDYRASVLFFLLSLLTYPTALGFVVVLFAIDFHRQRIQLPGTLTANRAVLVEKIPFVAATLLVAGITLWARLHATSMWAEASHTQHFSALARASQAFYIWAYYLWKPLAPLNLCPVYTQLVQFTWTDWPFLASAALVLGISIGLLVWGRRYPGLLALWFTYLALLVPMLGLTEHPHYPNDRYSYLASIPIAVLLGVVLIRLWTSRLRMVAVASAVLVLVTSSLASYRQAQIWHDSVTLFEYVIAKLGDDPYRCDVLWRLGLAHASEGRFKEAAEAYSAALKIQPKLTKAHTDLATVLIHVGQTNEAIGHYREVLRVEPGQPLANYNLGIVLQQQGQVEQAINCFTAAIRSETNNVDYRFGLASALIEMGRTDEAKQQLQSAVEANPRSPDALCHLAGALARERKLPEAMDLYEKALRLNPRHADAHYHLGTALAMSSRLTEATAHFAEAARLNPKSAQAHLACGMAFSEGGQSSDAASSFRHALQIEPNMLPALMNLGWLLAASDDGKTRNGPEAVLLAQRAVKLTGDKPIEAYDLLAAAYAEAGKWAQAVEMAKEASRLANLAGRWDISAELQRKLKLYEAGQPFRMQRTRG